MSAVLEDGKRPSVGSGMEDVIESAVDVAVDGAVRGQDGPGMGSGVGDGAEPSRRTGGSENNPHPFVSTGTRVTPAGQLEGREFGKPGEQPRDFL